MEYMSPYGLTVPFHLPVAQTPGWNNLPGFMLDDILRWKAIKQAMPNEMVDALHQQNIVPETSGYPGLLDQFSTDWPNSARMLGAAYDLTMDRPTSSPVPYDEQFQQQMRDKLQYLSELEQGNHGQAKPFHPLSTAVDLMMITSPWMGPTSGVAEEALQRIGRPAAETALKKVFRTASGYPKLPEWGRAVRGGKLLNYLKRGSKEATTPNQMTGKLEIGKGLQTIAEGFDRDNLLRAYKGMMKRRLLTRGLGEFVDPNMVHAGLVMDDIIRPTSGEMAKQAQLALRNLENPELGDVIRKKIWSSFYQPEPSKGKGYSLNYYQLGSPEKVSTVMTEDVKNQLKGLIKGTYDTAHYGPGTRVARRAFRRGSHDVAHEETYKGDESQGTNIHYLIRALLNKDRL